MHELTINDDKSDGVPEVELKEISSDNQESFSEFLKFGIPIVLSRLFLKIDRFGQTLILSKLGKEVLDANGLINPIEGVTTNIGYALAGSVGLLVSREFARNHKANVGSIVRQGWKYGVLFSGTLMTLAFLVEPILRSAGQSPIVSKLSGEYFSAYVWGIPASVGLIINENLFNGLDKSQYSFVSKVLNTTLTLSSAYLLGLGKLGFPKMGVYGVGIANTISSWVVFSGTLMYFCKHEYSDFKLFNRGNHSQNIRWLKEIAKKGWRLGAIAMTDTSLGILGSILIGRMSDSYLTPHGVVGFYNGLLITTTFSLSDALSIRTERDIANSHASNFRKLTFYGLSSGEAFVSVWSVLFLTIPRVLMTVFYDETNEESQAIYELADKLFAVYAIGALGLTAKTTLMGSLNGAHDMGASMWMNLFSSTIGILTMLLISLGFDSDEPEMINGIIGILVPMITLFFVSHRWMNQADEIVTVESEWSLVDNDVHDDEGVIREEQNYSCLRSTSKRISDFWGESYRARKQELDLIAREAESPDEREGSETSLLL